MTALGVLLAAWTVTAQAGQGDANWPQFRGPRGDGTTTSEKLPLTWSESENIVWKTPIEGRGWSSPVLWGKQVWMTTATPDGKVMSAICLDADSGRIIHNIKLFENAKCGPINPVNSYASPTPCIEAGRVYVHFGTYGTVCLDTATGKTLWSGATFTATTALGRARRRSWTAAGYTCSSTGWTCSSSSRWMPPPERPSGRRRAT